MWFRSESVWSVTHGPGKWWKWMMHLVNGVVCPDELDVERG